MTIHEGADLLKRVERYEAAVAELRAAHQDVKDVLLDRLLFERWQAIGAELGFAGATQASTGPATQALSAPVTQTSWSSPTGPGHAAHDSSPVREPSEAWAG
ncbi:hypothetical protein [Mangrovihabitans endophyticus]|uniref:Uncharacterized protein n=1 Tax=Mangrovihabitans endophyticus TaxID=1751298 RepID=A0A8J3C3U2_9ACTN|nr:hypothetical protein [Mangrovihabitans endophyticus]GGL06548.1 hypothetical protein GCM10012284_46030 [Mangrovihabitans endophyticus]